MSKTPETDSLEQLLDSTRGLETIVEHLLDHSRKLERERNAALKQIEVLRNIIDAEDNCYNQPKIRKW